MDQKEIADWMNRMEARMVRVETAVGAVIAQADAALYLGLSTASVLASDALDVRAVLIAALKDAIGGDEIRVENPGARATLTDILTGIRQMDKEPAGAPRHLRLVPHGAGKE